LGNKGKFGRAALAISIVASGALLIMVALGLFLMMTGRGAQGINYIVGMTILFFWFFELIAIVLGIIGLFEISQKKRSAVAAIAISVICFIGTFAPVMIGKHGDLH
jgi:hypothetical protein